MFGANTEDDYGVNLDAALEKVGANVGIGSNAITQGADNSGNTVWNDSYSNNSGYDDYGKYVPSSTLYSTTADNFNNAGSNLTTGLAGLKKFVNDNKSLIGLASAGSAMLSGSGAQKTGYQGSIPDLMAGRTMITKPPTRAQGYRPGAGGIDYGGDVSYVRTPGIDPWAYLSGTSGSAAGADLTNLPVNVVGAANNIVTGGANGGFGTSTVTGGAGNDALKTSTVVGGNDTLTKTQSAIETAIANLYKTNLGRTASPEEISYWVNTFGTSISPAEELIFRNAALPESQKTDNAAKDSSGFIADLYKSVLNRTGSASEIADWVRQFGSTVEDSEILAFRNAARDELRRAYDASRGVSTDANTATTTATTTATAPATPSIETLYQSILGRAPEAGMSEYWNNQFKGGATTGIDPDEVQQFQSAASDELLAKLNATRPAESQLVRNVASVSGVSPANQPPSIETLYQSLLGRAPDPGMADYWNNQFKGGATSGIDPDEIVAFKKEADKELAARSGPPSIETLYQSILGRAPDPGMADYWNNQFKGGSSPGIDPDEVAAFQAEANKELAGRDRRAAGGEITMAKGRYLQGGTDGMADKIPAQIGEDQPAALSHGEFVIPADVVSHMGNGNSDAGAKKLYQMMDKIRMARTGNKKQGKKINPDKFMPGGLASAYAKGGSVKHFVGGGPTAPAGTMGIESNLSNWAGPYVTNMLGQGQALANMPYQAYMGPLTAGQSSLQNQGFGAAAGLTTPSSLTSAAQTAGDVAATAKGLPAYGATTFGNQYTAPTAGTPTTFTNQYTAPGAYSPTTSAFDTSQATAYMNPYLQTALNPQLDEARRQSQITGQQNAAKMTQAGAFGGSRQAILDAENQRNLGTNLANITGQGYNTAYGNAMSQFNADQARKMNESQFGAQQGMTAAQLKAQFGLSAQQANEAARQFGVQQDMTAAQLDAQYGLAGQQATEASKQYGAGYGLQGLQTGLQAAQAQGALGTQINQTGINNLNAMLTAGAQQRGIESEGIAADKAQFEEARANPYKMIQYQQSLLQGLPLAAQSYQGIEPTALVKAAQGATTVNGLLKALGLIE